MINFLIIEPGNTKENCGICRKMPSAFPSQISCFCTFFSPLLNFVCDFFGLLKHIPIILWSHSKFPMPQQHCATGESPEELILGGCRFPQRWCKAKGISRLLFPLLLTWAANGSGRVNFSVAFPSAIWGFSFYYQWFSTFSRVWFIQQNIPFFFYVETWKALKVGKGEGKRLGVTRKYSKWHQTQTCLGGL